MPTPITIEYNADALDAVGAYATLVITNVVDLAKSVKIDINTKETK